MKKMMVATVLLALACSNFIFADERTLSYFYEVAKEDCDDIARIRCEMDRINNEILILITERTAYVKRAGDLKSRTTKIADDRQRVADQERKIIDMSIELELPIEISTPTFRALTGKAQLCNNAGVALQTLRDS